MTANVVLRIPVLAGAVDVTGLKDDEAREIARVWRRCGPIVLREDAADSADSADSVDSADSADTADAAVAEAMTTAADAVSAAGSADSADSADTAGTADAEAAATAADSADAADAASPVAPPGPPHPVLVIARDELATVGERAFGEHLVTTATRAAIESRVGERVLIHGAALAEPRTGATIALVGESGARKTTATAVLGRGLAYLTDETVSIGDDLGVERFEKPLSKLVDGRRPKLQCSPDELELLPGVDGARLAVVAVLGRDPDAAAPEARPMPLASALAAIVPQTSSLARLPRGLVRLCEVLDACGGAVELRYSEAESLAPLVARLLAEPTQPSSTGEWRAADVALLRVDDAAPRGEGPQLRRAELRDAVEVEGGLAVLDENGLTVLSGIAPAVLAAAGGWRTAGELVAAVNRELGEHPDAERLVGETIDALVEHRLLERRDADGA